MNLKKSTGAIIVFSVVALLFTASYYIGYNTTIKNDSVFRRTKMAMGTVVEFVVKGESRSKAEKAVELAFKEILRIDKLCSTYMEDNQVARINDQQTDSVEIDPELLSLLKRSEKISEMTGGAFTPALGNLIKLWGFESGSPSVPAEKDIRTALNNSGDTLFELKEPGMIIKKRNVLINLSAVAKGYAVDRAYEVLKAAGVAQFLINAGGEIRVNGSNWTLGVQHPREKGEIIAKIKLEDISVATSGDYEQYFEQDGVKYHHILDPSTGYPAKGVMSVTVITKDVETADALATGIFVMGTEKGLKLAEQNKDFEVMIVDSEGKIHMTDGFKNFIRS